MTPPLRPSLLLTVLTLALAAVALVAAPAVPAGAATTPQSLELGPLNPAFVEALHDPLVQAGLGRIPSPVQVHVGAAAKARAAAAPLPRSYDLVSLGRTTRVKDQGSYGTCWAFGSMGALESRLLPVRRWNFSEDNLVGRSGFYASTTQRYYQGGYDFMAIAYFARWSGPVTEADDPYGTWTPPAANRVRKHVQRVVMIPGRTSETGNDLIKQLVMANGALSVGMFWDDRGYNDYELNPGTAHASYYYAPQVPGDPTAGENHGVDIVGWDDDFPAACFTGACGMPPGDGAFLVRNSWGRGFGENGYFWVSYYDRLFAFEQGYGTYGGCTSYSVVQGPRNYDRNYGHDRLGVTARAGWPDGSPVWAANRFTARESQRLAAASFYTLSSGTPYEIWAGRNLKSLSLRASGTATLPGYRTVRLDRPMAVRRGRPFVVAVKLTSPDGTAPLAIEWPADTTNGFESGARGGERQSYVSTDGAAWSGVDAALAAQGVHDCSVCLRAFTK